MNSNYKLNNSSFGNIYKDIANQFTLEILRLLKLKDKIIIGVCGGRSVGFIFSNIEVDKIDWSRVHIFMTDERIVNINNEESNFYILNKTLLSSLKTKRHFFKENIHPFIINEVKEDYGVSDYFHEFCKFGGKYDLLLLSSGEDGHIAALFPNHSSIYNESEKFIIFNNSPKLPLNRMSMSKKMLLNCNNAILLFIGESKRNALKSFINYKDSWENFPAKLLKNMQNLYVFTDHEV